MEIRYSTHLLSRLTLRNIPKSLPRLVYLRARRHFLDTKLGVAIAVHKVRLFGKERHVAVVYKIDPTYVVLVTVHPLKPNQLTNRLRSGRWKPIR